MSLASIDRKRKILELLENDGKVKVKDLAVILKVSTETIRNYLNDLEQEEKLKKVYGGAINPAFFNNEPPALEREIINQDGKEKIGKMAVTLINDNDVIAIDEGSTPLRLARKLKDKKNLTIITSSLNSLTVLIDLMAQNLFSGKIIMLGGEVNTTHHRIAGELTLEMLNNIHVDKFFIAADGLSTHSGVTSYDISKGMVTKKLIEHSNKNILLIDHTKINKRTHYKMAPFEDIDIVVSDSNPPENWGTFLEEHTIKWLVANDENTES
ncbi:DeoR/GlpR family DNA-binding transcription regulator [Sporosarcina sp. FSL K6-1522]|uniref:DeoR/GlpR family DNA-binding transcription regulator n=1 Tax=Sporosarcina sp. FSL K6-1522 TaxID=2921554 RepID=UPI00315A973C